MPRYELWVRQRLFLCTQSRNPTHPQERLDNLHNHCDVDTKYSVTGGKKTMEGVRNFCIMAIRAVDRQSDRQSVRQSVRQTGRQSESQRVSPSDRGHLSHSLVFVYIWELN